jgi:hypothetical protein
MTRNEAIAINHSRLTSLDDEGVLKVADIIEGMAANDDLPRELDPDELAAIERSREDFRAGRTYSSNEAKALTDDFLEKLGVPRSKE